MSSNEHAGYCDGKHISRKFLCSDELEWRVIQIAINPYFNMNDEQIIQRGGGEEEINKYAKENGADFNLKDEIFEEAHKILNNAKWAFRSYGNQQGFKDQNAYAENEIREIVKFIFVAIDKIEQSTRNEIKKCHCGQAVDMQPACSACWRYCEQCKSLIV